MFYSQNNSSIHSINSDRDISLFKKILWLWLNFINNNLFSFKAPNYRIYPFTPSLKKTDFDNLNHNSSPSRALSNLFWIKIDYEKVYLELGGLHVFDTGTGSGSAALQIENHGGVISSFYGVDSNPNDSWQDLMRNNKHITFSQNSSSSIFKDIPKDTNLFITQSAVEHFDDDLNFFHEIKRFIDLDDKNVIQIHLIPSSACLKLYLLHGVRQYNQRTISKIVSIFDNANTSASLFSLGGSNCNKLHFKYITRPELLSFKKISMRNERKEKYFSLLENAINLDIQCLSKSPSFYALVIHSNFNNDIFKDMKTLSVGL
jgi:hypothetical protein